MPPDRVVVLGVAQVGQAGQRSQGGEGQTGQISQPAQIGEGTQAPETAEALRLQCRHAVLGVVERRQHEVLEQFHVVGIHDRGVDVDSGRFAVARHGDPHGAAAGGALDVTRRRLPLASGQLLLHGHGLAQQLVHVERPAHRCTIESRVEAEHRVRRGTPMSSPVRGETSAVIMMSSPRVLIVGLPGAGARRDRSPVPLRGRRR